MNKVKKDLPGKKDSTCKEGTERSKTMNIGEMQRSFPNWSAIIRSKYYPWYLGQSRHSNVHFLSLLLPKLSVTEAEAGKDLSFMKFLYLEGSFQGEYKIRFWVLEGTHVIKGP